MTGFTNLGDVRRSRQESPGIGYCRLQNSLLDVTGFIGEAGSSVTRHQCPNPWHIDAPEVNSASVLIGLKGASYTSTERVDRRSIEILQTSNDPVDRVHAFHMTDRPESCRLAKLNLCHVRSQRRF